MAIDLPGFVPDSRGDSFVSREGGAFVKIEGDALLYFQMLKQNMPGALRRLLGRIGSDLRKEIKGAMAAGGVGGTRWPLRTWLAQNSVYANRRRLKYLRATTKKRKRMKRIQPIAGLGLLGYASYKGWFGKIKNAVRYGVDPDQLEVQVGYLADRVASYASAVQAPYRGSKEHIRDWAYDFAGGDQPVTLKMRRFFFAIGMPLSKKTTRLHQPGRPVITPVLDANTGKIKATIVDRMGRFFAAPASSAA